jgi:hypothetical protein
MKAIVAINFAHYAGGRCCGDRNGKFIVLMIEAGERPDSLLGSGGKRLRSDASRAYPPKGFRDFVWSLDYRVTGPAGRLNIRPASRFGETENRAPTIRRVEL